MLLQGIIAPDYLTILVKKFCGFSSKSYSYAGWLGLFISQSFCEYVNVFKNVVNFPVFQNSQVNSFVCADKPISLCIDTVGLKIMLHSQLLVWHVSNVTVQKYVQGKHFEVNPFFESFLYFPNRIKQL